MNQKLQKTKKWLSIVLVAVMVLTAAPLAGFTGISFAGVDLALLASAEEVPTSGTWGDNLTWNFTDGVLTISGTGEMNADDIPVWLEHAPEIKSAVLEDGITNIADYAFAYCTALENITIPDSITSIGMMAFANCGSLTAIALPDSLTTIDICAFYGCASLTEIIIPDSVTTIGEGAFSYCTSLTEITIPDGVISIENSVFAYCDALTEITIPASVASIAANAFYFSSISKVVICNPDCEMGNECIPSSAVMFGYADSTAQAYAEANGNEFNAWTGEDEIPSDAIAFGTYGDNLSWVIDKDGILTISGTGEMKASAEEEYPAWLNYGPEIKSVVIADGITNIDATAFAYCTALEKITIPDSVTSIGIMAFANCTSLAAITIPDSVTNIDVCAFYGCSALTEVAIPDTVTNLGESAFAYCTSLTEITIPDGVTSIESGLFANCEALTEITIPASVTSIAVNAFEECTSLVSINVDENNANYSTYDGVLYNKDKTVLLRHPQGKQDDSFVFLPSVTTIGEYAFYGCDVCTTTEKLYYEGFGTVYIYYLNIPYTVTSVGANAFDSIVIPGGNNYFYYIEFYNPNCEIYDSASTIKKSDFLLIGGYDGSTAEAYTTKYNRTFASLGAMPEDHTPAALVRENEVAATCETEGSYDLVVYCADEGCNAELQRATVKVKALGHIYETYERIVEPGCETNGKAVAACERNCGKTKEYTLSALGHSFTNYELSAADPYMEIAYCDNKCGATDERKVAVHEHAAYSSSKENEVAATCEENGSYVLITYCVCGEEISREAVTESALGHSFTQYEQTVAPDCENEGKEVASCDNGCGETDEREVAALGHSPLNAVKENEVAATCEKGGSYDLVVYCDVCDDEISRETVTTDALGHTPLDAVKENEVVATCEKGGSYDLVVYCDVCGDEISRETVTTDALGHAFTAYTIILAPTCDEEGLQTAACDRNCGATDEQIIPALDHSFTNYESNGDATCMSDGTKTAVCDNGCDAEDTVTDKGSMLDHVDEDEDMICDECAAAIESECECICHCTDFFNKFVYKIVQYIRKLFGFNSTCTCGEPHTKGLTPIWKRI